MKLFVSINGSENCQRKTVPVKLVSWIDANFVNGLLEQIQQIERCEHETKFETSSIFLSHTNDLQWMECVVHLALRNGLYTSSWAPPKLSTVFKSRSRYNSKRSVVGFNSFKNIFCSFRAFSMCRITLEYFVVSISENLLKKLIIDSVSFCFELDPISLSWVWLRLLW